MNERRPEQTLILERQLIGQHVNIKSQRASIQIIQDKLALQAIGNGIHSQNDHTSSLRGLSSNAALQKRMNM